ncbi:energy transducer TonB [Chitinibacter bivalviorum]|uniref:Energy transducer TonB n=1 Tax=Chitinibacter bivalviorum TaxID=2739434 RepID=A0A7H9BIL2_9NEIS|nr:energy transducer TonB [Chitinibacter bivalviorum]QLG88477.1 energy transducer TonB [Chitinibacter bivalviorum]
MQLVQKQYLAIAAIAGCLLVSFTFSFAGEWVQTIKPEAHEVVVIKPPEPVIYPKISRDLGESGLVRVELLVGVDGLVLEARPITSGFARLDRACVNSVSQMAFKPLLRDGQVSRFKIIVPCRFILKSLDSVASAMEKQTK